MAFSDGKDTPCKAMLEAILTTLPILAIRARQNGEIIEGFASPNWRSPIDISGWVDRKIDDVLPEAAVHAIRDAIRSASTNKGVTITRYELIPHERVEEARVVAVGEDEMIILIADVTESTRAAKVLEESEARYRNLVEMSPDAIVVHQDGVVVFANPAAEEMFCNKSPVSLVGKKVMDFVHPDSREVVAQRIKQMAATGQPVPRIEETFVRADGSPFAVEVSAAPTTFANRRAFQVVIRDVTERRKIEEKIRLQAEELAKAEKRYRSIFENAIEGIYQCDLATGRMITANPAMSRMLGYSSVEDFLKEAQIRPHIVHEADTRFPEYRRILEEKGEVHGWEYEAKKKDGKSAWFMESARVSVDETTGSKFVEALVQDVSDRKELEEELRQAQKLEAIGRLAGGIAHDFNNLLTAIIGYSSILQSIIPEGQAGRREVEEIVAAGQRAARLTSQLLSFSRKQLLKPTIVDLNEVVLQIKDLVRRLIGEDITLVTQLEPTLGQILADKGSLEQVIINLAVNARDAMEKGGVLKIETQGVVLAHPDPVEHPGIPEGRWVRLSISDTGHGMDETIRARIFEPFFTTKAQGKGTGLGLAVVYGIIKQSGGYINIWSRPGEGTTFHIYLPQSDITDLQPEEPSKTVQTYGPATGTILVIEDDEAVRQLIAKVLSSNGYKVLVAEDGEQALSLVARLDAKIDLLLTDMLMPGMTGEEVAQVLLDRFENIKVLFSSGFTKEEVSNRAQIAFIQKPFTPAELLSKVREVLDKSHDT